MLRRFVLGTSASHGSTSRSPAGATLTRMQLGMRTGLRRWLPGFCRGAPSPDRGDRDVRAGRGCRLAGQALRLLRPSAVRLADSAGNALVAASVDWRALRYGWPGAGFWYLEGQRSRLVRTGLRRASSNEANPLSVLQYQNPAPGHHSAVLASATLRPLGLFPAESAIAQAEGRSAAGPGQRDRSHGRPQIPDRPIRRRCSTTEPRQPASQPQSASQLHARQG